MAYDHLSRCVPRTTQLLTRKRLIPNEVELSLYLVEGCLDLTTMVRSRILRELLNVPAEHRNRSFRFEQRLLELYHVGRQVLQS